MGGCVVIKGTTTFNGPFQGFIANTVTVVDAVFDSKGNNVTTTIGLDSGFQIQPGGLITMPEGEFFSSIKLTSGDAIGYRI